MIDPIYSVNYKGHVIALHYDEDPIDPIEDGWGLGTMVFMHRNHSLGHKHALKRDAFKTWDEVKEHLIKKEKAIAILPVFMYDHSGITINTTGFSGDWDWGQIGWIYTTAEAVRRYSGAKRVSKQMKSSLADTLKKEIEVYDGYLTGQVYGFIIDPDNDGDGEYDSCWGYYDKDEAIKEAKSELDAIVAIEEEKKEILSMPDEELALHINRQWLSRKNKDAFMKRFKHEGVQNG
jgi:hypothetical protein